jgi:hypothetical protein
MNFKNNEMNLKRNFLVLCLIMFITSSCEEDFLKDELLSTTSVDFLLNSEEGLEIAVVGLYTTNRVPYEGDAFNGANPLILQAKSDLALGLTGEISLYSRLLWGFSLGDFGTATGINSYWVNNYKLIARSNEIIAAAESLTDIDEAKKNQILAEAKCMRAKGYFTLYRLFNNIFVNTTPATPDNVFDVPQDKSSEEDIFAILRSDLDFAIVNLDYTTQEFGRWTQGSARHLRAKVAMWEEDWEEAANQADSVITSGYHSLVANTKDVFTQTKNHSETLFAVQFENETIGGGGQHIMNWSTVANSAAAPGIVQSVENGGAGIGFLTLNDYAIDLLNEDPNDDRKNNSYYIFEYLFNDESSLPAGKQIGDPLDLYVNHPSDANQFQLYYFRQNPGVLKFLDRNVEPTDRNHFSNVMVYRLAETYLIGAEAHMMNGNSEKGMEYLNDVRKRANATPVTSIDLQVVLDERARELAFEGQRWFTLKRTGKLFDFLVDHMNNDNMNESYPEGNPKEILRDYMQNWPIPQGQINLLGPNYPQNDGYN